MLKLLLNNSTMRLSIKLLLLGIIGKLLPFLLFTLMLDNSYDSEFIISQHLTWCVFEFAWMVLMRVFVFWSNDLAE